MYDCIRLCQGQGYLRWFLGAKKELPLTFVDNKSALALSRTSVTTKRSKHYALRYLLVRDYFKDFGYVPTDLNLADALTNPSPARSTQRSLTTWAGGQSVKKKTNVTIMGTQTCAPSTSEA